MTACQHLHRSMLFAKRGVMPTPKQLERLKRTRLSGGVGAGRAIFAATRLARLHLLVTYFHT